MNKKIISSDKLATEKLMAGIEELSRVVGKTLGPGGNLVLIDSLTSLPQATKDGVTVAKSVSSPDRAKNMGMELIKQASEKTASDVGDGTTTATVLTNALLQNLIPLLKAGHKKRNVIEKMKSCLNTIKAEIRNSSVMFPAGSDEFLDKVHDIAMISGNNDSEIAFLVKDAFEKVFNNGGVVKTSMMLNNEDEIEVISGYEYDRGFISPDFANNKETMEAFYSNPLILFYEGTIKYFGEIEPLLIRISQNKATSDKPLVIVADSIEGSALGTLTSLVRTKRIPLLCVKAPSFGDERKEIIADLCAVTGAVYVQPTAGMTLDNMKLDDLGQCGSVLATAKTITFMEAFDDAKDAINDRISLVESVLASTLHPELRDRLETRLGKLKSGVVNIKVGGVTEAEAMERRDRVEDAVCAVKAAIKSGYVPGGGTILYKYGARNDKSKDLVVAAVAEACKSIAETICKNVGAEVEVLEFMDKYDMPWEGFNALSLEITDLLESGVIDPTSVVESAVVNAFSVAETVLSTTSLIVIDEETSNAINNEW